VLKTLTEPSTKRPSPEQFSLGNQREEELSIPRSAHKKSKINDLLYITVNVHCELG
jgi:hypothetical protein